MKHLQRVASLLLFIDFLCISVAANWDVPFYGKAMAIKTGNYVFTGFSFNFNGNPIVYDVRTFRTES